MSMTDYLTPPAMRWVARTVILDPPVEICNLLNGSGQAQKPILLPPEYVINPRSGWTGLGFLTAIRQVNFNVTLPIMQAELTSVPGNTGSGGGGPVIPTSGKLWPLS